MNNTEKYTKTTFRAQPVTMAYWKAIAEEQGFTSFNAWLKAAATAYANQAPEAMKDKAFAEARYA